MLYDRTTESDDSLALQDAIRFNGTQKPTMSNKSINEYAVGVDAYWDQLNYWNWSSSGSPAPSPESCRSTGRTGNETVKANAGLSRVYCRDETEPHQPTTISYVRFVDVSHFDDSPAYVTIEVWFQQAT